MQTTADKYNNNYFNSSKSNEFSRQRRPSLYNFPLPAVNIPDNEGQEKKINPNVQKIINAFTEIIIHHLYLKKLKSPHMNYLYVKQDSKMIYQN